MSEHPKAQEETAPSLTPNLNSYGLQQFSVYWEPRRSALAGHMRWRPVPVLPHLPRNAERRRGIRRPWPGPWFRPSGVGKLRIAVRALRHLSAVASCDILGSPNGERQPSNPFQLSNALLGSMLVVAFSFPRSEPRRFPCSHLAFRPWGEGDSHLCSRRRGFAAVAHPA
jgi:hypothetical protein